MAEEKKRPAIVFTKYSPYTDAAVIDRAVLQGHYADSSEKVFKPIRAFCAQRGIDAVFVAKVGLPAEVIASTATKGRFDLLMMGSHGHGAIGSLVMGSVATKVMASCQTPLLIEIGRASCRERV